MAADMRERPILFSGPMVRKILADEKTQTRRVINSRHVAFVGGSGDDKDDPDNWGYFAEGEGFSGWVVLARGVHKLVGNNQDRASLRCPYGEPGDRLWVRETWALWDGGQHARCGGRGVTFRADCTNASGREIEPQHRLDYGVKWKPSIHMPRWASRLTLEVKDVRVQRLQNISEDDARAEGAERYEGDPDSLVLSMVPSSRWTLGFAALWESINGKRPGASWADNPFVWALSFRRVV